MYSPLILLKSKTFGWYFMVNLPFIFAGHHIYIIYRRSVKKTGKTAFILLLFQWLLKVSFLNCWYLKKHSKTRCKVISVEGGFAYDQTIVQLQASRQSFNSKFEKKVPWICSELQNDVAPVFLSTLNNARHESSFC